MDIISELTEYIKETYNALVERPWEQYPENTTFKDVICDKWFALIMKVERRKLQSTGVGGVQQNNTALMRKNNSSKQNNSTHVDENVMSVENEVYCINLKAEPIFISDMAGRPGYFRGYHMNKDHWITLLLDGTVPMDEIKNCIDRSFTIVTDSPTRRIYEAVKKIPAGHVATYGQVAAMAGNPKMQRAVGNALHKNPDESNIPCFRVVNSKGELSGAFAFGGKDEQANRLKADGVDVVDGKVDLEKYGITLE